MVRVELRTLESQKITGASAGQTKKIDLPTDFFIQKILVEVKGLVDTGSSVSPSDQNAKKQVARLKVYGNVRDIGSINLCDLKGIHVCQFNHYDTRKVNSTTLTTSTSQTDSPTSWYGWVDFRLNPYLPLDFSALIPAFAFDSLSLEVQLASLSDFGSGYTAWDTISITPSVVEVIPSSKAEKIPVMFKTAYRYEEKSLVANTRNDHDLPVGEKVDRLMIITQNSTPAYADLLDKVAIMLGSRTYIHPETSWLALKEEDKALYSPVDAFPNGLTMLELGFDASRLVKGDWKLFAWCLSTAGTMELVYKTYI
jgi:hypothetical protein